MEKFPEVNWSEVCRSAVIDYISTRSLNDFGETLAKLRTESMEDYNQGRLFFYKLAPQMTLSDFEKWYPEINKKIIEKKISPAPGLIFEREPYWEAAELQAIREMRNKLREFCKSKKLEAPKRMSDAFCKGAIRAFMQVYRRATPKR